MKTTIYRCANPVGGLEVGQTYDVASIKGSRLLRFTPRQSSRPSTSLYPHEVEYATNNGALVPISGLQSAKVTHTTFSSHCACTPTGYMY